MSNSDLPHKPVKDSRGKKRMLLLCLGSALVGIGWLCANVVQISTTSPFDEASLSHRILIKGALPWFLQWTGVACASLFFVGSRVSRNAAVCAILVSFTLGAIWWVGIAYRLRGMDPLEAIGEVMMIEIAAQFGSGTAFDRILFGFIGPLLGPLQLRGPMSLHGWNFVFVLLSTTLIVGYLLLVGCKFLVTNGSAMASDYARFIAALLPLFLPPFIRLGIRIMGME